MLRFIAMPMDFKTLSDCLYICLRACISGYIDVFNDERFFHRQLKGGGGVLKTEFLRG